MASEPAPTSTPPAAPAPAAPPDGRSTSPLHQAPSPASLAVAARSAADPAHPSNTGLHVGAPPAPSRGGLTPTEFALLPIAERAKYTAVRRPGGWDGAEYFLKGQIPRDDAPSARPGDAPAAAAGPDTSPTIKVGELEISENELRDLMAHKAAQDLRAATLPTPDAYALDLPADFKAPPGVKYEFDAADPMVQAYKAFAHESGLSQAQFTKGLGLIAALRVSEQAQIQSAYQAEIAKLGAAAPQRVDACVQFLNAYGGPKAATLANMFKIAPVADTIEAVEHIMLRVSSQGAARGSSAHQAPAPTGPTQEQWNAMSFGERMDYARTNGGRR